MREGATFDSPGSPRLKTLRVTPEETIMIGLGAKKQLKALGTYTDGSTEDLTLKVQYTANDESVADVSPGGELRAKRAGETAIMVRTLGKAVAARIAVVEKPPMPDYPAVARNNFIDELVFAKLKTLNIIPSRLSSDEEFLRRIYLDTIGLLPTLDESRVVPLESNDPQKRAKLIEAATPGDRFSEVWATKFSDLFRVGLLDQGHKGGRLMYNWLRKAVREDKPYNQFATELLTASGNLNYNPTANFYYVTEFSEPENIATDISQVFLGGPPGCRSAATTIPGRSGRRTISGASPPSSAAWASRTLTKTTKAKVLLKAKGEVLHPKTKQAVLAKYLDGPTEREGLDEDVREKLAAWLTAPNNPWFSRAIVNRIVGYIWAAAWSSLWMTSGLPIHPRTRP